MTQTQSNEPLVRLRDSGFIGSIHAPSNSQSADVVFAWWASTPTERQAKRTFAITVSRLHVTNKLVRGRDGELHRCIVPLPSLRMPLPQLRDLVVIRSRALLPRLGPGYQWHGPYLFVAHDPKLEDLQGLRDEEPDLSEDDGLAHLVAGEARHATALRLARKILARRQARADNPS